MTADFTKQILPTIIKAQMPTFVFVGHEEDEETLRVIDPLLAYTVALESTDGDVVLEWTNGDTGIAIGSPDANSISVTLTPDEWVELNGKNYRGRLSYVDANGETQVLSVFEGRVTLWP